MGNASLAVGKGSESKVGAVCHGSVLAFKEKVRDTDLPRNCFGPLCVARLTATAGIKADFFREYITEEAVLAPLSRCPGALLGSV